MFATLSQGPQVTLAKTRSAQSTAGPPRTAVVTMFSRWVCVGGRAEAQSGALPGAHRETGRGWGEEF